MDVKYTIDTQKYGTATYDNIYDAHEDMLTLQNAANSNYEILIEMSPYIDINIKVNGEPSYYKQYMAVREARIEHIYKSIMHAEYYIVTAYKNDMSYVTANHVNSIREGIEAVTATIKTKPQKWAVVYIKNENITAQLNTYNISIQEAIKCIKNIQSK